MENSVNLKKQGLGYRTAHHPVAAFIAGLSAAAICGLLGSAHGEVVAAVMAVLGAAVGAPLGAMLAASTHEEA